MEKQISIPEDIRSYLQIHPDLVDHILYGTMIETQVIEGHNYHKGNLIHFYKVIIYMFLEKYIQKRNQPLTSGIILSLPSDASRYIASLKYYMEQAPEKAEQLLIINFDIHSKAYIFCFHDDDINPDNRYCIRCQVYLCKCCICDCRWKTHQGRDFCKYCETENSRSARTSAFPQIGSSSLIL